MVIDQGLTSAHLVRPMIDGIKELYECGEPTLQRDAEYVITAMAAETDLTADYTETFLENFVAGKMPNLMSTFSLDFNQLFLVGNTSDSMGKSLIFSQTFKRRD